MSVKWGIVSTVKAPLEQIESFAAHHLDLGAHRIFLYLDEDDPAKAEALNRHPKLRVTLSTPAFWAKQNKPWHAKHQARQTANAAHAYARDTQVDWIAHIDVDELIAPRAPLVERLAALPAECLCARMRPVESLAPVTPSEETYFKAFSLPRKIRDAQTAALYPTYGPFLNGGFLSHVAGKLFYRTGLDGLQAKIHNIYVDGVENPGQVDLTDTELLHLHAKGWVGFIAAYRYRLAKGSYRASLGPNRKREQGGVSMHELFTQIEAEHGEAGLRAFYDEVCTARADLLHHLATFGLLRQHRLTLDAARARHFG